MEKNVNFFKLSKIEVISACVGFEELCMPESFNYAYINPNYISNIIPITSERCQIIYNGEYWADIDCSAEEIIKRINN